MVGWAGATIMAVLSLFSAPDAPAESEPAAAIPDHALLVYEYAADTSTCGIDWSVLAGVGAVASDHGRVGGPSRVADDGTTSPIILGAALDGTQGVALVPDTDSGALDTNSELDHAVGPFQFIPTTWAIYGTDGNGDGIADPGNLWDAAAGAAAMLCDKGVAADLDGALESYFGTDEWNDWARRKRDEALAQGLAVPLSANPTMATVRDQEPRVESDAPQPQVVTPTQSASVEEIDGSEPVSIGPTLLGDWNGDGIDDGGTFEYTEDGGRFVLRDAEGRPYGRAIPVDELLPETDLQTVTLLPLVGDWDGDGTDTVAVAVVHQNTADVTRFDRAGVAIETTQFDDIDPVETTFIVVDDVTPAAKAEFARSVQIHDGSTIDLWSIGSITVEESIADSVAQMVADAAADGIVIEAWGWRSHEQQIGLRRQNCADVWTTPASGCNPPTAVPGTSRHETGRAIDVHVAGTVISTSSPQFEWLTNNAARYGLKNLPSEPWHWSVDGS